MSSLSEEEKQIFHKLLFKIDVKERKELIYVAIHKHDEEISQKFVDDFFHNVNMIKVVYNADRYYNPYAFHKIGDLYHTKQDVFLTIQDHKFKVVIYNEGSYLKLIYKLTVIDTSTLKEYTIHNDIPLFYATNSQKTFNRLLYDKLKQYSIHFIRPKGRKKISL